MPPPTVRDVWRLALPTTARLAGGEAGLGNRVLWARRMAVHPPAFAALEDGDIALLSLEVLSLLDERLTLARVVQSLARRQASAVAVAGEPSTSTVAISDEQGLPLFILPSEEDLRDIERDVIRLIVEHEAQVIRRGQEIYHRLMQASIENGGLTAIAEDLVSITGKPVAIQDARLGVEALALPGDSSCAPEPLVDALVDGTLLRGLPWRQHLDGRLGPWVPVPITGSEWTRNAVPIIIEGDLGGFLSLLSETGLDDLDRLCLVQGALVCAVEIAKQRAVAAAEDRMQGDFLDTLLTAGPARQPALARRAREMGYRLEGHHRVSVLSLAPNTPQSLALLASEFRAQLLNTGIRACLCPYEGDLVVLCNADEPETLRQLDDLAHDARLCTRDRLARTAGTTRVAIGIGRPGAGLAGLRQSLGQAHEALSLARDLFDGDRVLSFSDMGAHSLLCPLQGSEELREFYDRTLGPLVQYDASHNTQLVDTLDAYLAHLGNVSQTAESLYLHRNSLLYRLDRISEITGLDLNDADDRFSLQLALRTRPFLGRSDGPG